MLLGLQKASGASYSAQMGLAATDEELVDANRALAAVTQTPSWVCKGEGEREREREHEHGNDSGERGVDKSCAAVGPAAVATSKQQQNLWQERQAAALDRLCRNNAGMQ